MSDVFELLAVPSEENAACPWTVAYSDHIALNVFGTVVGGVERLIVPTLASRGISY